jgi:hypothetical protein
MTAKRMIIARTVLLIIRSPIFNAATDADRDAAERSAFRRPSK